MIINIKLLIYFITILNLINFCESEKSKYFDKHLSDSIEKLSQYLLPLITELENEQNISFNCSKSISEFMTNAIKLNSWAIQMLDSSGRIPTGILDGTVASLGQFENCLSVDTLNSIETPFVGQYCLAELQLPLELHADYPNNSYHHMVMPAFKVCTNASIYNAFCVPSVCDTDEIKNILEKIFIPHNITVHLYNKDCQHVNETQSLNWIQKFMLLFLSTIFGMIIISIYNDFKNNDETETEGYFMNCVKAFSPKRNIGKYFEDKVFSNNSLNLSVIDGIRVCLLLWILIAHVIDNGALLYPTTLNNMRRTLDTIRLMIIQIFANSDVILEAMFTISAILTVVSGLKFFSNSNPVKFKFYLFYRVFRVTPIHITIIGMNLFMPLLGSGPTMKKYYYNERHSCEKNIWKNILYINSFDNSLDLCTIPTWYLSTDIHLYILGFFALKLLASKPIYGLIYSTVFIILGMVIPGALTYYLDIPPPLLLMSVLSVDQEKTTGVGHFPAYQHFAPYFMGIITGYVLSTTDKIRFSESKQNLISIILLLISTANQLSTYLFNGLQWELTKNILVFYSLFFKFIFTVNLCWVIIVTVKGNAGPAGIYKLFSIFSIKQLSRISFTSMMCNVIIVRYLVLNMKTHLDLNNKFLFMTLILGTSIITLVFGFIIHIFIEMPFNNIFIYFNTKQIKPKVN